MRIHKKTLVYYDFAAKLWAKGYPDSVIMDAVLERYGIHITNFNDFTGRYRKDFPYRTKEQSSLNKSTGSKFSAVNRDRRRKLVEKALLSCSEDKS